MSQNIIVTGANGNLGSAIADKLVAEGFHVIGLVRYGSKKPNPSVDYYDIDLTSEKYVKDVFEMIERNLDSLSGVVCTVGGFAMNSLEDTTADDLDKMWNLNFKTTFLTAQASAAWMKKAGGGNLIFTGARQAVAGGASGVLPYAISKGAVIQLADIINETSNDTGVKASVIIPSIIDTPQNREGMPDANFDQWVKPEEIAESVAFLLSEKSSPLRGTVLKIYGKS
ncbi:MAG: SDR family NAD(P)-dependent oxidoreductase [Cyclobacteriaceae bacterium]